jgi:hypothetical protein
MMAIDAVELSVGMRPQVAVLVTGDANFAHQLRLEVFLTGFRRETQKGPLCLLTNLFPKP